jgi:signal transduction histidine kinase
MKDKPDYLRELLSYMSYEVRTPLNGIIGFSELLFEKFKNTNGEHKEWVHYLKVLNNITLSAYYDLMNGIGIINWNGEKSLEQIDIVELLYELENSLNNNFWMTHNESVAFILESEEKNIFLEADKGILTNMFRWFFGEQTSFSGSHDRTTRFLIRTGLNHDSVQISISNVTGKKNSAITKLCEDSVWPHIIMKILKAHSGSLTYKTDGKGKTYAEISLPIKQKKI